MCGLYQPLDKKVLEIDLPEAGEKVFKGSGHGWIVTQKHNGSIDVVNPLTRVGVPLPPRYKFPDVVEYHADELGSEYRLEPYRRHETEPYHLNTMHVRNCSIQKIVLSSSPASNDFRAVAIYGVKRRLAYCKLGDENWCDLEATESGYNYYMEMIFCDGKLYAISGKEELLVRDDIVSRPEMRKCVPAFSGFGSAPNLINSSECPMVVSRHEELCEFKESFIRTTVNFVIYKLDMSSSSWIRMKSLGYDEIMFMGLGTQMGISSRNFRGSVGNQILFVYNICDFKFECEDLKDCFDNGIFNVEDKNITP